jgi:hypothetical protein
MNLGCIVPGPLAGVNGVSVRAQKAQDDDDRRGGGR